MKSYDCKGTLADSQRAFIIPFQYDPLNALREREKHQPGEWRDKGKQGK